MKCFFLTAGIGAVLLMAGCAGHQPLPTLRYPVAAPLDSRPGVPTSVSLEAGRAVGHSLTSYALMPGGWAMPITSPSTGVGDFNVEDQAAFVENLVRVLAERGAIQRIAGAEAAAAAMTVKFLRTEHFPDMQDYALDVLVTVRLGERTRDKVYHVNTMDHVSVVARMFQNGIDGRRNAAEALLAAMVPDVEQWLKGGEVAAAGQEMRLQRPFAAAAPAIAGFLAERYSRPTGFWTEGIHVAIVRPSARVLTVEFRRSPDDPLPPYCLVDIYDEGDETRIVIREKNRLLAAEAHVAEALSGYFAELRGD